VYMLAYTSRRKLKHYFLVFNLVLHVKISDTEVTTVLLLLDILRDFGIFRGVSKCLSFIPRFQAEPQTFFGTLVFRRTLVGKHCTTLLGMVSGVTIVCFAVR
jgi:hypothetical protein